MKNRHVLFIIADDWSPMAGCYGDGLARTPHIDALARRATVFDQAFCTTPSCAASRASILTGQHSHRHLQFGHCHGPHHFRTLEDMPTLPSVLGKAGVRCTLVGKKHTAPDATYPWAKEFVPAAQTPAEFADPAASALAHDQPGFTLVAPLYPHRMGDATNFGLDFEKGAFDDHLPTPDQVTVPDFLPDLPEVRQDLAYYYGGIARWDQCVGAVLASLEKSGRAEATLVIVTTDHGMPFPGAKASCYDTGHHCPLIIHRPGQQGGLRCDALVNWLDLAPTIYDWLGVEPPNDPPLTGRSLLPILEQEHPDGWDTTTFSHTFHEVTMYDPYRVLRGRRYKFVQRLAAPLPLPMASDLFRSRTWTAIRQQDVRMLGRRNRDDYEHRPAEALYDLEQDPMETRNRIDDPALRDVAREMKQQLMAHRQATQDPWLMLDYQRNPEQWDIAGP